MILLDPVEKPATEVDEKVRRYIRRTRLLIRHRFSEGEERQEEEDKETAWTSYRADILQEVAKA